MKYIDVHSHLYFPDYDEDREAAISRARDSDVGIITVGVDLESSRKAVALAETHENMWAIVGLHPVDAGEVGASAVTDDFDYLAFKELALHPKVVAIGECGLDYFHMPNDAADKNMENEERIASQKKIFIRHIQLANEVGKPLMLHVRNGKKYNGAYRDALDILKKHAKVAANFHFFTGSAQDLEDIIDAGYGVSFTGVITFARDYDKLVKAVPLDRIMSETDAPFVSPTPYRGKRNEPSFVIKIVEKIAEIRGEEAGAVSVALVKNAKKFFNI